MNFVATTLPGVFVIEPELHADDRGSFARTFCVDEFEEAGLKFRVVQANTSFNKFAGTVRGMHYQASPCAEAKVVRCTSGALHDVVVDLRPGSPTLGQWFATELNAENRKSLFMPEGCAHGFQTLVDNTEVSYLMSERYVPDAAAGVRYDDPALGIEWPLAVSSVSDRDRAWPDFQAQAISGTVEE
jgi:dTDP-4-dehydrorhamnose 3,5-epimerase